MKPDREKTRRRIRAQLVDLLASVPEGQTISVDRYRCSGCGCVVVHLDARDPALPALDHLPREARPRCCPRREYRLYPLLRPLEA